MGSLPEHPGVEWFVSGYVDRGKLDEYLLSADHPVGRYKFRLWRSVFGFEERQRELLERLIREQLPQAEKVTEREPVLDREYPNVYYRRFEIVIPEFAGPNGNVAPVATGWASDPAADRPHLTNAYPVKRRSGQSLS
jgi:hypothetical protein